MNDSSKPAVLSSPASTDAVLYSLSEGLATLTLNRPDKLNSLNAAMHTRLRELLGDISSNPDVRAVLLTAGGRGFCAGQDLEERKRAPGEPPPDLGRTIEQNWNPLARALRYLRVPIVCAVNGVAAGAGINIALACDIVIAARSASFVFSFSRIGLLPDAGGTYYLPRLVGSARAMGMALLGERLSAAQAASWGLIWECVADEDLAARARDLACSLADGPTLGLGAIRQAMRASPDHSFEEQIELERRTQRQCGASADYREGVTAFMEKRPPRFKGM